jgi:hypothetical protein
MVQCFERASFRRRGESEMLQLLHDLLVWFTGMPDEWETPQ